MTLLERQLASALHEAMEWNWLDEVPPPVEVEQQCKNALFEFSRQLEQERNSTDY